MTQTLDTSKTEPGMPSGIEIGYTALKVAQLCGYTTDRWTRDRRQELERLLMQCREGQKLIAALKTRDGNRYSQFALEQIQALQRATSTGVPVLKDGKPVFVRGVAKLQKTERQMTLEQYAEALFLVYGKTSLDESDEAESEAELPPGAQQASTQEDAETVSTEIVWESPISTAPFEMMDNNAQIVSDTRQTFLGFRGTIVQAIGQLGGVDGAAAAQQYLTSFQGTFQQGLADMAEVPKSDAPKTARRTTKKKQV